MAHILLGDAGSNFLVSRPIFFFSSHVGQAYDLVAVCSRARLAPALSGFVFLFAPGWMAHKQL